MTKQLPTRPNLDVLKREAKTLLKSDSSLSQLAEAQHQLAQTYGCVNWAELKLQVDSINTARLNPEIWLKRTESPKAGEPHPNPDSNWWVALANGDSKSVSHQVNLNPTLATTPGGPLNRHPIHYATCQNVTSIDLAGTVATLLAHGADPNQRFLNHPLDPNSPLSPLWGAIQIKQSLEAATLLVEAGADPNDGESVYHAVELPDPRFIQLLLKHGVTEAGTNGLARALDFNRMTQVQLLLESGANPNQALGRENLLCHAIRRNRNQEFIELLLQYQVSPGVKSNEGFTPFKLACLKSPRPVIEYLRQTLPDQFDSDAYSIALLRFKTGPEIPRKRSPAELAILPQAAFNGRLDEIKNLLANGWPVDAPDDGNASGSHGATGLHCACFAGYHNIVDLLITAGADINMQEPKYRSTPLGWALHGSTNSQIPGGNHLECVRLLVRAGVERPKEIGTPSDEIFDFLAENNYLPS